MILTEMLFNEGCLDSRSDDFFPSFIIFCSLSLESKNKII